MLELIRISARSQDCLWSALECLKKLTYNLLATLAPSLLIGTSSFLQVIRTTINEFWPDWTIDNIIACL